MQKLQIGQAVGAGIKQFFGQFRSAVKIGWVPLVILVLVHGIFMAVVLPELEALVPQEGAADGQSEVLTEGEMQQLGIEFMRRFGWLGVIAGLVTILAYVMVTTGWLRFLLRRDDLAGRAGMFQFGGREFRMLGASVLLMLVFGIVGFAVISLAAGLAFVIGGFVNVVILVVYGALMLAFVRMALLFPMVALDQGANWGTAWRLGRGNSWRLFWTYFVITFFVGILSFVAFIPVGLVSGLVGAMAPGSISFGIVLPLLAYDAIYVGGFMITLGSLADCYRQLNGPGAGVSDQDLAVFDD